MEEKKRYSRSLWEVVKRSLIDLYEHMGYTFLLSLIWFFMMIPVGVLVYNSVLLYLEQKESLFGLFLFLVPYVGLVVGPVYCALFYQASKVVEDYSSLRDLWIGFRRHYTQAAKVFALYAAVLLFALADFFICIFLLEPMFMKFIGIIILYLIIFILLIGVYLPGFIVLQENTVKKVFKKSTILLLDNTLFTILAGVIILLPLILLIAFPIITPLLFFAYGGFLQFFGVRIFLGLMEKYPDVESKVEEDEKISY